MRSFFKNDVVPQTPLLDYFQVSVYYTVNCVTSFDILGNDSEGLRTFCNMQSFLGKRSHNELLTPARQ